MMKILKNRAFAAILMVLAIMVAAACVYFTVKNGRQAALMAPTEILARQHYETLTPLMERLGIRCALLAGSTPARLKKTVCAQLADGEVDFAVGTHASLLIAAFDGSPGGTQYTIQYALRRGLAIADLPIEP